MRKECWSCDGQGRVVVDLYDVNNTNRCLRCDGTGRVWDIDVIVAIAFFVLVASVVISWFFGVHYGMDVEAFNRNMVAVGELQPPASHLVANGDTLWDLAVEYYPTVGHKGKVVDAMRRMNPDVDPGNLRVGVDWIDLPRLEEVR